MKTFNKLNLLSLFSCALLGGAVLGSTSNALASDGTIEFSGELIAASCDVTAGSGSTGTNGKVAVKMGKVSMDSLGESGTIGVATQINLKVTCSSGAETLKMVKARFDPQSGSGIDNSNPRLLKLSGSDAAKGVAIAIHDEKGQLDLSANNTITGPLTIKDGVGTADLSMRASYVKNGHPELTPGSGNATLPFTLTYE